ncbi:hypothetical protein DZC75_17870 [Pseudomonas parafulva]|uniref:Uncharacterized protein n=1 Tax=Pseudomonas parafulva TaxID=157782 RepID=A0AAI8KDT2_9PSED|nr:hypothetical protein [Pseudomonas parafulva]AXO89783.1 hypothetical protein DZC75_17870 [Pseudomonas parafulva]
MPFNWEHFFKRFFPIAALSMLLTIIASSIATVCMASLYLSGSPHFHEFAVTTLMLCILILTTAQYAVIRGLGEATWLIVMLLILCLMCCLWSYLRSNMPLCALVGTVTASSAMACLNSRRYRQLCKRVKVIRRMRERLSHTF